MKRLYIIFIMLASFGISVRGQAAVDSIVAQKGDTVFTRSLHSMGVCCVETANRPLFAVVKDGQGWRVRFEIEGVPLDEVDYCKTWYGDGMRTYLLGDHRWNHLGNGIVRVHVMALHQQEGAIWQFICDNLKGRQLEVKSMTYGLSDSLLAVPAASGWASRSSNFAHLVMTSDRILPLHDGDAFQLFQDEATYYRRQGRLTSSTANNTK